MDSGLSAYALRALPIWAGEPYPFPDIWTGGLVIMPDTSMTVHRAAIIAAAARNKVPAVYIASDFVRDGGLLSYAPVPADILRRVASYVDRILRGEKPGDLPVQFPTKFEMVVNVKTAKALGLNVPQSILLRADEVIE